MKINILYEDKNILVIDKPSGISVHGDGRIKDPSTKLRAGKTITDWVLKNYPKIKGVGEAMFFEGKEIERPGIMHRLDKDTSGVLILAKNQKTHEFIKEQFINHKIKKVYVAIVSGWVKNDHGIINKPIGRSPSDFRRRLAGRGARGELREAITEYKVLKRFEISASWNFSVSAQALENFSSSSLPRVRGGSHAVKNFQEPLLQKFSLLEVFPKTGRTHQIRVHMKYLNHPVVCDSLYAPKELCPKGLGRLALHAKSIEFKNPKGKILKVESPLPKEFKRMLKYKDETGN